MSKSPAALLLSCVPVVVSVTVVIPEAKLIVSAPTVVFALLIAPLSEQSLEASVHALAEESSSCPQ
jgi:hypothetical protein